MKLKLSEFEVKSFQTSKDLSDLNAGAEEKGGPCSCIGTGCNDVAFGFDSANAVTNAKIEN